MRISFFVASLLACVLVALPAGAQDKVAEGEYEGRVPSDSGTLSARTATRWTLYRKASGGYSLRSEILGPPELQGRFFQVEELNEKLVPTAIGYKAYWKGKKRAMATSNCRFAQGSIACRIRTPEGSAVCKPYKHNGPFFLWIEDLFVLDLPWLMGGAANMAHLEQGKVNVSVVIVGGKDAGCDLTSEDEGPLESVETQILEVAGVKVEAKHYTMKSGGKPVHLWIANSGLLIKMSDKEEGLDFVLANYKQYKPLIPELPVAPAHHSPPDHNGLEAGAALSGD